MTFKKIELLNNHLSTFLEKKAACTTKAACGKDTIIRQLLKRQKSAHSQSPTLNLYINMGVAAALNHTNQKPIDFQAQTFIISTQEVSKLLTIRSCLFLYFHWDASDS